LNKNREKNPVNIKFHRKINRKTQMKRTTPTEANKL